MKKNLLSLLGMAFVAVAANAQTWTAPTLKLTTDAVPESAYLYNVGKEMFLSKGAWWGTHAALTEDAMQAMLYYYQLQDDASYKLHCPDAANTGYLARESAEGLYTDFNNQENWGLTFTFDMSGEYVHVLSAATDPNWGSEKFTADETNYGLYKLGCYTNAGEREYPLAVHMVDPTLGAEVQLDWGFVLPEDYAGYSVKKSLYDALQEAVGLGVDYSAESAVYNNASATNEELSAAAEALKEKNQQAKAYAVLEGASEDNPKDATSLLVNPNFDGNNNGWTNTFEAGVNANNVAWQSASYTNGDVSISGFIEAWSNNAYGTEGVRSLGVGELSQTMKSLPAGKYMLSVDVIAVNQDGVATSGVQLFAKGGELDNYREVATGNEKPEHFDVTFISTGGDITMGLRTIENATANWIAADNFHLMYYGETTQDPEQVALQMLIDEYKGKYPYADDVEAPQTLIDAYKAALAAAESATGNYTDYATALTEAANAMAEGMKKYEEAKAMIEAIGETINVAEEKGWEGLMDNLAALEQELQEAYENKELTLEEIADINKRKATVVGEYISANVKAGDDVSILLSNPGFDKDFSGWTVAEGSATPAWGGFSWDGKELVNDVEGGVQPSTDLGSGNAEVYHAAFDISQTVHNMPVGLYTLSCQAFSRDDNGDGITAELYAVMNGAEQTVKVKSLTSEGAPEALFLTTTTGGQSDLQNGPDGTWIPNGMTGANVYFSKGYYKNEFNILVTEATDITVGIRDASGADWVLFDDFKFVYKGNSSNAYAATIQDLIVKLDDKQTNNIMSQDILDAIADATAKAEAAIAADDSEACIASVKELEELLVKADENIALILSLEADFVNMNENLMGSVESTYEGLAALIDELGAKIDGGMFATEQEVKDYIYNIAAEWTKYVQFDVIAGASEEAPADVTVVIFNPSGVDVQGNQTKDKWDDNAGGVGLGNGCTEMFNKETGASFTQTIKGLAPGWYRLGVQGFYRGIGYTTEMDANDVDTIPYYANIVAGEKATRLRSLKSDAEAYNTWAEGAVEGKWVVPASMEAANNAFENGMYQNWLQFEVKEGEKDVTIGIVKTGHVGDDWTIFDNWTLFYLGTAAPAEDVTTAIESTTGAEPVSVKVYGVAGTQQSRLQKGVNIIKTTLSDGTVRISKVLVK